MSTNWRETWNRRPPRERALLLGGAAFLLLALLYAVVVDPILSAGRKAEKTLPELRQQTARMRTMAEEAQSLKARSTRPAPPDSASLAESARRFGLTPRISPAGEGRFNVVMDTAAPAAVMDWLAAVQKEHRLYTQDVRLTLAGGGTVRAQLVLAP